MNEQEITEHYAFMALIECRRALEKIKNGDGDPERLAWQTLDFYRESMNRMNEKIHELHRKEGKEV